jgi:hypothetical protein
MKAAIGVLVNNEEMFAANFKGIADYDVFFADHPPNATMGLNTLLDNIGNDGNDVAIILHQDVALPIHWFSLVDAAIHRLPENWLVAGAWGMEVKDYRTRPYGSINDVRLHVIAPDGKKVPIMQRGDPLPHEVDTLDEVCLIINLKHGFRFADEMMGFDLYGTYICQWAKAKALTAWAIDAPIKHLCTRDFTFEPDQTFMNNWNWLHQRFPGQPIISTVYQ